MAKTYYQPNHYNLYWADCFSKRIFLNGDDRALGFYTREQVVACVEPSAFVHLCILMSTPTRKTFRFTISPVLNQYSYGRDYNNLFEPQLYESRLVSHVLFTVPALRYRCCDLATPHLQSSSTFSLSGSKLFPPSAIQLFFTDAQTECNLRHTERPKKKKI